MDTQTHSCSLGGLFVFESTCCFDWWVSHEIFVGCYKQDFSVSFENSWDVAAGCLLTLHHKRRQHIPHNLRIPRLAQFSSISFIRKSFICKYSISLAFHIGIVNCVFKGAAAKNVCVPRLHRWIIMWWIHRGLRIKYQSPSDNSWRSHWVYLDVFTFARLLVKFYWWLPLVAAQVTSAVWVAILVCFYGATLNFYIHHKHVSFSNFSFISLSTFNLASFFVCES